MRNSDPKSERECTIFLLAHCDDEFFVLPHIKAEAQRGKKVYCVYTTDGAANKDDPEVRLNESAAVLGQCGVMKDALVPLGSDLGVRDGDSFNSLPRLFHGLVERFQSENVTRIYTLAWEGGHADHDACHLLAVALSKYFERCGVFEFSGYRSSGLPLFNFICMSPITRSGGEETIELSLPDAIRWFLSPLKYVTQRKTFLGLLPFCLRQILFFRVSRTRRVLGYDYQARPHEGPLLYEQRFHIPYEVFKKSTNRFVERHILNDRQDEFLISQPST